jgi:hypothetical protein
MSEFMADKHSNPSEIEDLRDREMNRLLDDALARFTAIEPRTGLEDRILAHLRGEQTHIPSRARWQWGLAVGLLTVVIMVLTLVWISWSGHTTVTSNYPPVRVQSPEKTSSQVVNRTPVSKDTKRHERVHRAKAHDKSDRDFVAATPKLGTFPSPHALSEQEKLLAAYVAQFHDEAVIIAKVRTEASIRERQQEMQEAEKSAYKDSQAR